MHTFQTTNIMKKLAKFIISLALSFIFAWLTFKYSDSYLSDPHQNNGPYELVKQISSIAGVILGFVLAAISILTAVMDKTLISNMMRTGHFKVFIKQAFYGCAWLMILIIICLASLVLKDYWLKIGFAVIIGVTTYTVVELTTTANRFYNIIITMSKK